MPSKKKEPKRLSQGKKFHNKVQDDWLNTAEGEVESEKSITKPGGRRGRMDIFVKADNSLSAIAEIKDSNWDAMTLTNVRRNVKRPKDKDRMILIEKMFDDEGIPVVWEDESIEKNKTRFVD